jgi:hypothetical protein
MQNKIVARFLDGRVGKGFTSDFMPTKDLFHLALNDAPAGSKPVVVALKDLKAIFFVKDFLGNKLRRDVNAFDSSKPVIGKKIKVVFKDGETLVGTTQGYQSGRPGFFVMPSDAQSNIERCYVVSSATKEISFIP